MAMQRNYYRRNLPHWQPPGATFFITCRLDGSLPASALRRIEETRNLLMRELARANETEQDRKIRHYKKLFAMMDAMLDKADYGPLWLRQKPIADLVEETLLTRNRVTYALYAYVVMPNHIHIFLRPQIKRQATETAEAEYYPLEEITRLLKGYTARQANLLLNRTGHPFWQQESYDHWARNEEEFHRIIAYIENNPVKAGLVSKPEDWLWSSA
jgi:REP element-mobilizing transposase RayT